MRINAYQTSTRVAQQIWHLYEDYSKLQKSIQGELAQVWQENRLSFALPKLLQAFVVQHVFVGLYELSDSVLRVRGLISCRVKY